LQPTAGAEKGQRGNRDDVNAAKMGEAAMYGFHFWHSLRRNNCDSLESASPNSSRSDNAVQRALTDDVIGTVLTIARLVPLPVCEEVTTAGATGFGTAVTAGIGDSLGAMAPAATPGGAVDTDGAAIVVGVIRVADV
jgi:hypothetical protein